MTSYNSLVPVWVGIVCLVTSSLSQSVTPMTDKPDSNPDNMDKGDMGLTSSADRKDGMGGAPVDQKPPVWLKCMADSTGQDVSNADIKGVFESWCSNYEAIIQCMTNDLAPSAQSNPFDFFINLEFDPERLMDASEEYCGKLKADSSQLTCSANQNQTLATICGHAFTRGLFHIYGLFKEKNAPQDVLSQIACEVTTQTTFCLRQSLTECPTDAQSTLLNYYALFSNDTCVASEDYRPPGPQPKRPDTVVIKCATEAAQSLTPEKTNPEPSSIVDFVVLGLKSDCKTYAARFSCYDRELRNITNFLDFWLSLTFNYANAIASQKAYCDQIEALVIPQLTTECFNKSQPALAACETGFGRQVETIRKEWVENPDFDAVQLQTLACRTSVTRATCLGDAMKHCGQDVARAMAVSEMGILPDLCRQLLAPTTTKATGGQGHDDMTTSGGGNQDYVHSTRGDGDHHRMGEGMMGGEKDMAGERPLSDQGYKEHRNTMNTPKKEEDMMESDGKMKNAEEENSTSGSQKDNGMGGGVTTAHANYAHIIGLLLLFAVFRL